MNIDPILQAVRQAAMLCREVQHGTFHSIDKENPAKNDKEPVTIADYGSQAIICRAIQTYFPDDAIIAEEAGDQFVELTTPQQRTRILNLLTQTLDQNVTQDDVVAWLDHGKGKQATRTWIIDPIDGTKGFIAMRHYAIGVGIVEDGKPTGGIMAAPGYGDGVSGYDEDGAIFFVRDGKAYKCPIRDAAGECDMIQVSSKSAGDDVRVVQSYEKEHASKNRMRVVREKAGLGNARVDDLDSMEKYALVAAGEADVYLRLPNLDSTRPHFVWDHAPGVALVLAAGGQVTDYDGTPLDFSQGATLPNKGMLVSNGVLHDALVQATIALIQEEQAQQNPQT